MCAFGRDGLFCFLSSGLLDFKVLKIGLLITLRYPSLVVYDIIWVYYNKFQTTILSQSSMSTTIHYIPTFRLLSVSE